MQVLLCFLHFFSCYLAIISNFITVISHTHIHQRYPEGHLPGAPGAQLRGTFDRDWHSQLEAAGRVSSSCPSRPSYSRCYNSMAPDIGAPRGTYGASQELYFLLSGSPVTCCHSGNIIIIIDRYSTSSQNSLNSNVTQAFKTAELKDRSV